MTFEKELSRLFQAERTVQPPPHAFDAGWSRLTAHLAAGATALPVTAGPLKLILGVVPKWLLGGFALGVFGAGTATVLFAPSAPTNIVPPAAQAVKSGHTQLGSVQPRDIPNAASALERAPAAPLLDVATARPTSVRARMFAVPTASAQSATFDAELALITLAKAELDGGRPGNARAVLAQHAELFPTGAFATERDALSMIAECQAGPKKSELGSRFAVLHPGSPLVQRVDRACASSAPKAPFLNLPNGGAALGEPITEPKGGTQR